MDNKLSGSEVSEIGMEIETALNRELGEMGKYQIYNIILMAFPAIFGAFMIGDYVFTAAALPTRCYISECDTEQPQYAPVWILNAIPETSSGFDNCYRYANVSVITETLLPNDVCSPALFDRNKTIQCERYVHESTNTVVYDFNLECKEWLRALPGTLNSLGTMVALVIAGFISDRFGRRASVVIFSFFMALLGSVRAFSVNYEMYVALQFLQTALGGAAFSALYILAAEIVGTKYRVRTSATLSSCYAFGQVLLGVIAFAIPDWRTLSLVLFVPVFLLMSYYWLLTESHRWLLSKNKQIEGRAVLEYAARLNGKHISEKSMTFLLTTIPKQMKANIHKENLFLRVIKSPVMLRRCCTTPILWISTVFIYYGLSINSVNMTGNMHINYIANAAVEIPGFWTAVMVLDRIGRRLTLFLGFLICAFCCAAFAFTPANMYGLSLFLFLTGKFCIGAVMTSLYLYTVELYPTRYRHSFLGFSSMLGRIGSVVAPLTVPLMAYWSGIPSLMFALMALISSFLVLTQPETKGLKVPDTIEDAERLGKKK